MTSSSCADPGTEAVVHMGALKADCAGIVPYSIQARNIMIHEGKAWIIDFQGGKTGPLQYDLASLLAV